MANEVRYIIACRVRKFCLVRVALLEMGAHSRPSLSAASECGSRSSRQARSRSGQAKGSSKAFGSSKAAPRLFMLFSAGGSIRGKSYSQFEGWVLLAFLQAVSTNNAHTSPGRVTIDET